MARVGPYFARVCDLIPMSHIYMEELHPKMEVDGSIWTELARRERSTVFGVYCIIPDFSFR